MKVEIRSNGEVRISGYVNAVERDSKVLPREMCPGASGSFVERVRAGAFRRALSRGHPIEARFNHARTVGTTGDGTLSLAEDNIGLYAELTTRDPELVRHAERRELRGWSFGFSSMKDAWEEAGDGIQRRTLEDIDLLEVSVLTMEPAYIGTSIEMRGETAAVLEKRSEPDETTEITRAPDESARYREIEILKMRGKRK